MAQVDETIKIKINTKLLPETYWWEPRFQAIGGGGVTLSPPEYQNDPSLKMGSNNNHYTVS